MVEAKSRRLFRKVKGKGKKAKSLIYPSRTERKA